MNFAGNNNRLLRLLQLASPLLPVGGYSYSEGLENLIAQGTIFDRVSLTDSPYGQIGFSFAHRS